MKLNWKWIIGILLILALIVLPLAWQIFMPYEGGFGMTLEPGVGAGLRVYRYGMPMIGGYGMMPFGRWLMWLIPLGVFVLIGFAFGWAANQFTHKSS